MKYLEEELFYFRKTIEENGISFKEAHLEQIRIMQLLVEEMQKINNRINDNGMAQALGNAPGR